MTLVYNYSADTGEYVGSNEADIDPMETQLQGHDVFLIPANATLTPPPMAAPGNIIVYDGGWKYVKVIDGAVTEPTDSPQPPSVDEVAAERERRLAIGFGYDFGDERGVHFIATSTADMIGWDEVTKLANALLAVGTPDVQIDIVTNSGPVKVTAMEWQHILIAAGQYRQPIYAASFLLQAQNPIPEDYKDDKYWPAGQSNMPTVELEGRALNMPSMTAPFIPLSGDPNNAPYEPPTEDETP